MGTARELEVGKSAYYIKGGSTVCRGKILSEAAGPSYRIKGAREPILCSEVFNTDEEARASIVPQRWWRGNNGN